ncbi:MAG: TetR/AcrR family transcriptional regulator [Victivallales bacterium]|nr:TetR/AcrR family transcriptional regulator [Victivallales bacterium]
MRKTRELILQTALRLFSQKGFEAVSVRDIAAELELTAPALYVHFKSKLDILEAILRRMEERDAELSGQDGVPQETFADNPNSYDHVSLDNLMAFTLDMFRYWTEDEFAVRFRHLLTIEQFRDKRFADLFQQYLGNGVVQYLEDIFRKNAHGDPHGLAVSFWALFRFLLEQYDVAMTKKAKILIVKQLETYLKDFAEQLKIH